MEILSEHLCQGWLEGYLLTGRHGLFNCYEAFIHIIDSMFNQHAKWLKTTREIPWRRPIASLNYLLSSHVWRQDHNGFSHQDPGFIDHVVNKKAEIIRVYLPPDANTLLSVADHCLRSRNYVNVVVAGKQPALDYLPMDDAIIHCTRGLGIWDWASSDDGGEPDVVLGCAGDIPTLETLAAAALLREHLPELKVRVINVVDLMRLQSETEHPHGLSDSGVRRALHDLASDRLRLPRLPVADPPAHLPAPQPREPARARLQGGGDDDDAVRHGHAQRPRPLPSRHRRDRPRPRPRRARRPPAPGDGRAASARPCLHQGARRRRPGDPRLDVASLNVLVVNAGSTSLKLSLVDDDGRSEAVSSLQEAPADVDAVGHRVVHGGERFREPVLIDAQVLAELEAITELAPLHNPPCAKGARGGPPGASRSAARRRLRHRLPRHPAGGGSDLPAAGTLAATSSACAATASRASPPSGPRSRCRCRGSSSVTSAAAPPSPPSATAARSTRPWASRRSRGCRWRPARGPSTRGSSSISCVTGTRTSTRSSTRCSTSPACSALSGLSPHVHELEAAEAAGDERARAGARDLRAAIAQAVAAAAVALDGLDAIVFTAGAGERSATLRARVCSQLGFLGVGLDARANDSTASDGEIAAPASAVRVFVIASREDLVIARDVRRTLASVRNRGAVAPSPDTKRSSA